MERIVRMLTPPNARRLDVLAVERYSLPTLCLMENAARALAEEALRTQPGVGGVGGVGGVRELGPVVVVCGPGNNGGDGFAAARHLHNAGVRVAIVATGQVSQYSGDAAINAHVASRMGLEIQIGGMVAYERACQCVGALLGLSLIVDAVFGTGLNRPADGFARELIEAMNARPAGTRLIAADIPSGLDAVTGRALGACVRADVTVTFAGLKPGLVEPCAKEYTGRVVVADIGVPRELLEELGTPYTPTLP